MWMQHKYCTILGVTNSNKKFAYAIFYHRKPRTMIPHLLLYCEVVTLGHIFMNNKWLIDLCYEVEWLMFNYFEKNSRQNGFKHPYQRFSYKCIFVPSEFRIVVSCFKHLSYVTNKDRTNSRNNLFSTLAKFCLLGTHIILGKSSSGGGLCLCNSTLIREPVEICFGRFIIRMH